MIDKSVKIKCRLGDSLDIYRYKIKIYDEKNNLIIADFTDEFGNYVFNVSQYGIYKIVIINHHLIPIKKCIIIFVDQKNTGTLYIIFNKFITKQTHLITVNVSDYNYEGLPLTNGKVILRTINK